MQLKPHVFRPRDLIGGHVVLDLVNTATARNADRPIDWLDGYPRLLEWAALTGEFDQAALGELGETSVAQPRAAALALRHTRELRETLHEVLAAILRNRVASASALDRLARHWKDAVAQARVGVSAGHVHLQLSTQTSGLEYLNHELALRSLELLQTLPLERTRVCSGQHCGWLFIDRSRGGQRRWCDMATCGNVVKSRRHYERIRDPRRTTTDRESVDDRPLDTRF